MLKFFDSIRNRRIEKQEERNKMILKEENELDEHIETEIRTNYYAFSEIWLNVSKGITLCVQLLDTMNISINEEDIFKTFRELYKMSMHSKTLQEFDDSVRSRRLDIVKNEMKFIVKNNYESKNAIPDYYLTEQVLKGFDNYTDVILYECANKTMKSVMEVIDEVTATCNAEDNEYVINEVVTALYYQIEALVRMIILYRYKERLVSNDELYKIQHNLFNQFSLDDVKDKIYLVYTKSYESIFQEKLSSEDLGSLVFMINSAEQPIKKEEMLNTLEDRMQENEITKLLFENIIISIIKK